MDHKSDCGAGDAAIVAAMVRAYQGNPVAVAVACNEILDRSGDLLRYIREAASSE